MIFVAFTELQLVFLPFCLLFRRYMTASDQNRLLRYYLCTTKVHKVFYSVILLAALIASVKS